MIHPGGNSFALKQKWFCTLQGQQRNPQNFPVSSARPAWERIQRGLWGPAPFIVDSAAHPPPRSHKWRQPFVRGEWSRFTVDGLPTKDHGAVTTGPGSAAPTFTQCDLTPCFTQSLMQTQPLQSLSIHVAQRQSIERHLLCFTHLLLLTFQAAELRHCQSHLSSLVGPESQYLSFYLLISLTSDAFVLIF